MNATDPAKQYFQRKRPFLVDEGSICITATPEFAKTFDYPSSHATTSWAFALILSEIEPANTNFKFLREPERSVRAAWCAEFTTLMPSRRGGLPAPFQFYAFTELDLLGRRGHDRGPLGSAA
jgi:hypothetical protein